MRNWAAMVLLSSSVLAGCGGGGAAPAPGNTTTASAPDARDPMEEKIAALTDVQRRVTFYRALLDSDFTCKKVVKIEDKPRQDNRPVWLITCDDGGEYTVALAPGGTFAVSGVPQTRPRFPKATATPAAALR